MRRRVVRDLGTLIGVVVILAGVVLANDFMRRGTLTEQMDKVRRKAESDQKSGGTTLLPWELLRKTKGTRGSGPTFDSALLEQKDGRVNLVGFMVPMYEFRQVTEFLLLPLPIECYFCQAPPMRDVVLVQMAPDSKVDIAREPVVINGDLALNEGPGLKFFYVLKDSTRGVAQKGGKLTRKNVSQEHIQHAIGSQQVEQSQQEKLQEGKEPPKPATNPDTKQDAPAAP